MILDPPTNPLQKSQPLHDIPSVLYHYTSYSTTEAILSYGNLRLTYPRAGNDRWELKFGAQAAQAAIRASTTNEATASLLRQIKFITDHTLADSLPAFLMSMSESSENERLWHEYADNHSGCAIGIQWAHGTTLDPECPAIAQVLYGDEEVRRLAEAAITECNGNCQYKWDNLV